MARTSATSTVLASTSVAAGSTTNSSSLTLTADYGAMFFGTMTNGATAPTLPMVATCQVSNDGSTWYTWATITANLVASAATPVDFEVPIHTPYARVSFGQHTGQAVTAVCLAAYTTGL